MRLGKRRKIKGYQSYPYWGQWDHVQGREGGLWYIHPQKSYTCYRAHNGTVIYELWEGKARYNLYMDCENKWEAIKQLRKEGWTLA